MSFRIFAIEDEVDERNITEHKECKDEKEMAYKGGVWVVLEKWIGETFKVSRWRCPADCHTYNLNFKRGQNQRYRDLGITSTVTSF